MSDTTTCPDCSATLPASATFCTSCGHRIGPSGSAASTGPSGSTGAASGSPASAPTGRDEDATRVDNPALHDRTQTFAPPVAPSLPPSPASPWQPAQGGGGPSITQPPQSTPPPAAPSPPWGAPPGQSPPPWQQPQPGGPQPGGPQQWGPPGYSTAPPQGSSSSTAGSPLGAGVVILGAILTLIGLFTAWIGINKPDTTFSGWALVSGDEILKSNDPYLILALGVAALVVGVVLFTGTARSIVRIAAVVIGLAVIGIAARDWLSITDVAKDFPSDVKLTAQFGFYLTIAGGIITAVAAVLPAKKS